MAPERRIVGFHQDEEGQWVAELECGHARHVRHDPPWEVRPWTRSAEGRAGRLGTLLLLDPAWDAPVELPVDVSGDALLETRRLCRAYAVAMLEGRFPKRWQDLLA